LFVSEPVSDAAPPPILGSGVDVLSLNLRVTDIDPKELARQMTLIDSCMFRQIPNYEWLQKSWGTPRYVCVCLYIYVQFDLNVSLIILTSGNLITTEFFLTLTK